jgi:hypothetical protein
MFDKTKTDHRGTPQDGDGGEEAARAEFSNYDGCGRLKENVWDEEDAYYEGISCSNIEPEIFGHSGLIVKIWGSHEKLQTYGFTYPAILAAARFVRSIKEAQYRTPNVRTRRRSTRCMMLFCSAGVNWLMCAKLAPSDAVGLISSKDSTLSLFSMAALVSRSSFDIVGNFLVDNRDDHTRRRAKLYQDDRAVKSE